MYWVLLNMTCQLYTKEDRRVWFEKMYIAVTVNKSILYYLVGPKFQFQGKDPVSNTAYELEPREKGILKWLGRYLWSRAARSRHQIALYNFTLSRERAVH